MKPLLAILAALLLGAAPAPAPMGKFQTWSAFKRAPLDFTSGGVTVHVEALPCPPRGPHPWADTSCNWDGYNNQGAVTVTAPGVAPVRVLTDRQSSYARIAVVRFSRRDARSAVVVESQYGGSGGLLTAEILVPGRDGYSVVPLTAAGQTQLEGQIADDPRDLSGDGVVDLRLTDGRFDSAFECNACSPRPPLILSIRNGASVDLSNDPSVRPVFVADMARNRAGCASTRRYRNGACAAYVADAARAGRFDAAWGDMLRHYERPPTAAHPMRAGQTDFPATLRAFLIRTGYIHG